MHLPSRPVRARYATAAMFFAAGLGFGGWAALIPSYQHRLQLSDAELGVALLTFAIGAMVAMPLAGLALIRIPGPKVALISALGFSLIQAMAPHATSLLGLCAIVTLSGAFFGCFDVALNTHATLVEKAWGHTIMSSMHALFSLGGFAAATVVGALITFGAGPAYCQTAVCLLIAVIALAFRNRLDLPAPPVLEGQGTPSKGRPSAKVLGFGALSLLGFMVEGGMGDWSGVYFVSVIGTDLGAATSAYAAFALVMGLGRLTGDIAVRRLGSTRTLWLGAALGMAGLALALLWPRFETGIIGFALVGLGIANIVPILLTAAGRDPGAPTGVNVSVVAWFGYSGLLLGPPLVGFSAALVGLQASLAIFVIALGIVAGFSWLVTPGSARSAARAGRDGA
ncbi:MAG TPA: MFS transporter [Ancylobacter sp.]